MSGGKEKVVDVPSVARPFLHCSIGLKLAHNTSSAIVIETVLGWMWARLEVASLP